MKYRQIWLDILLLSYVVYYYYYTQSVSQSVDRDVKRQSCVKLKQKQPRQQHAQHVVEKEAQPTQLAHILTACLLYTSPSPRDLSTSRMPSSA